MDRLTVRIFQLYCARPDCRADLGIFPEKRKPKRAIHLEDGRHNFVWDDPEKAVSEAASQS